MQRHLAHCLVNSVPVPTLEEDRSPGKVRPLRRVTRLDHQLTYRCGRGMSGDIVYTYSDISTPTLPLSLPALASSSPLPEKIPPFATSWISTSVLLRSSFFFLLLPCSQKSRYQRSDDSRTKHLSTFCYL